MSLSPVPFLDPHPKPNPMNGAEDLSVNEEILPLPQDFITDLLSQLSELIKVHLLKQLLPRSPQNDKDGNYNPLPSLNDGVVTNTTQSQSQPNLTQMQRWILLNITSCVYTGIDEMYLYYYLITHHCLNHLKILKCTIFSFPSRIMDEVDRIVINDTKIYPPNTDKRCMKKKEDQGDFFTNGSFANAVASIDCLEEFEPCVARFTGPSLVNFFKSNTVFKNLKKVDLTVALTQSCLDHLTSQCTFPSLQRLSLNWISHQITACAPSLSLWIETLPVLEQFELQLSDIPSLSIAQQIANSSLLSLVTSLKLGCHRKGKDIIMTLLQSPAFMKNNNISTLELCQIKPTDSDLLKTIFETSPHLSNLTSLRFTGHNITHEDIKIMVNSPYSKKLTRLDVSFDQTIDDDSIKMLIQSPTFQNLTNLTIPRKKGITSKSLQFFIESQYCNNLTNLSINYTVNPGRTILLLSQQQQQMKLKSDEAVFHTFIQHPKLSTLNVLNIESDLTLPCLVSLAQSTSFFRLTNLKISAHSSQRLNDIQSNDIDKENNNDNDWVEIFSANSFFSNLCNLQLSYCNLKDSDLFYLAQSPYLSNLTHLNLSNNDITDVGVEYLINSPYLTDLKQLSLSMNEKITTKALENMFNVNNSRHFMFKMKYLGIRGCSIDKNDFYRFTKRAGWIYGCDIDLEPDPCRQLI